MTSAGGTGGFERLRRLLTKCDSNSDLYVLCTLLPAERRKEEILHKIYLISLFYYIMLFPDQKNAQSQGC